MSRKSNSEDQFESGAATSIAIPEHTNRPNRASLPRTANTSNLRDFFEKEGSSKSSVQDSVGSSVKSVVKRGEYHFFPACAFAQ